MVTRRRLSTCVGGSVPGPNPWITGVTLDSRAVKPGDLFVAARGARQDGHDYIDAAVRAGARAVVAEHRVADIGVPVVQVGNAHIEAGHIAARYHGHPSRRVRCIGITGTNGKTSVAFYCAELSSRVGIAAAYGGTIGWGFRGRRCSSALTTEDAVTLQQRLATLEGYGARWAAMEVSSHALDQHRADAVEFEGAVFTNLTRDHLDFHGTMARYGAAKARLFEWPSLRFAVINVDDELGRRIAQTLAPRVQLIAFGAASADTVHWTDVDYLASGLRGTLVTPWGQRRLELRLLGDFALANLAAAVAAVCAAGAPFDAVMAAAERLEPPPGRMQCVRRDGRPLVIVDYAHTPDALEKLLAAVRRHCGGELICVFGCGGDRDRGKRALMAAAVEAGADRAFVTSDNPRSENPRDIVADIMSGFGGRIPVVEEIDRRAAIEAAIGVASPRDVVVVAGKGHEDYQEIAGVRSHFSDVETVQQVLR